MFSTPSVPSRVRRAARAVLLVVVGVVVAVSVTDVAIGWVIPFTVIGGGLIAALLLKVHSRPRPTLFLPDAFAGNASLDMINASHIRVAGVGGLGLVVAAFAVGFQYPLGTAMLIVGAIGGVIGGTAVVLYRRRLGPFFSREPRTMALRRS
jgi:hypothetical protein